VLELPTHHLRDLMPACGEIHSTDKGLSLSEAVVPSRAGPNQGLKDPYCLTPGCFEVKATVGGLNVSSPKDWPTSEPLVPVNVT
jgi:hypothetical protein